MAALDLAAAREQVNMMLAQMQEGRVTLRQVEEARLLESEKWLAIYDTGYNWARAKYIVEAIGGAAGGAEVSGWR